MRDPLPEDIAAALAASSPRRGVFGQPLTFLPSTASTNDVASALAERGAPEGALVLALAQTSGRGRHGRVWVSPPGAGLYFSVVLRGAAIGPVLTLAGGVAVAEGIRRATALPVDIKWPNDIVVRDSRAPGGRRKLAGILAEGSLGAGGVQHMVLGVGINVHPADYPLDLAPRVTSLEAELGRAVSAGLVLAETLASLNAQIADVRAGMTYAVLERWRALAPTAVGTRVRWATAAGQLRGTTAGVDSEGALLVRREAGTERIISGEVEWL